MKIAVAGAAGRTGRHVVDQARASGHEVIALVRDASRIVDAEGVVVIEGDARESLVVDDALGGADALISVLSLGLSEDEPQYSKATRALVAGAERAGLRRVVVVANNNVFGDHEVSGEFAAQAREHRRNRDTLRDSSLAWTIAAAPWVVDGPASGEYRFVLDAKAPGGRIATADLAKVLLDALDREEWVGHIVGVSG